MRYYDIKILDPSDASVLKHWTSYDTDESTTNPNAQNIEMDIPKGPMNDPMGGDAFVRIWGIPLEDISQSADFTFKNIVIKGGYKKGLPYANSSQSGLIVKGMISNSFGNWIGTDMTLDLYITSGTATGTTNATLGGGGSVSKPKNIIFSCSKGETFANALSNTFKTAFPNYSRSINIDSALVASEEINGHYHSLQELADHMVNNTKIMKSSDSSYPGVMIWIDQDTVYASDWTQTDTTSYTQIAFKELIGQPTYGVPSGYEIQFMCPMRADLFIGSVVKMPKTLYTTTSSAQSGVLGSSGTKASSIFKGTFIISHIRFVGNFRSPDGTAWMTVFNAYSSTV